MAYFKLITFGGLAPQISPRLLADNLAQTAEDVILDSGRLTPIRNNTNDYTLDTAGQNSIYKYRTGGNEYWLEWADEGVDVVPGPIAGDNTDRLYWTGESASFARMSNNSLITTGGAPYPNTSYRLGIPAPTAAPNAAISDSNVTGTAISFDGSSASIVIVADDTITITTAQYDSLTTGDPVKYSDGGGTVITGLADDTTYFVIKGTSPKIKLASTAGNATAGTGIDLTGVGAGSSHSITPLDDKTQTKYSTSYVYTFVSAYGEEGPPSAASTVFDKVDGQTVTISGLETTAGSGAGRTNTNITKKRIYRSNTGSNTTAFQFVKEVTLATASTTDALNNSQLAEVIPSTYWIGPPNEVTSDYPDGPMKGLTAMPNGIFAGFTGKRICFSEPFLPHAWPVAYRITLEEEIVGIKMAGQGLIVATKGTPYLIAGTDPQSMSVVRIEAAQACQSKTSIVDMGPYVVYAGGDGLVAAAGTDVSVLTEGLISPEQWRADYYPSSLRGFLWEGRYVGLYTSGSNYGGFIFDPRGAQENTLTHLTQTGTTDASGGFTNPVDNELYLIVETGSGPRIQKFQGATTNKTFTWKTKEFVTPKPTSMGFVKVVAEEYPVTVKVYGDGTLYYNAAVSTSGSAYSVTGSSPTSFSATAIPEPILRLPSKLHSTFEIQVESAKVVNEICIGESIDELREI
tara:strand:+ start:3646 stop:5703 length:2058 start_codon:yes stop_codon:yes gene_type:complete